MNSPTKPTNNQARTGEELAWSELAQLNPQTVETNAGVTFEHASSAFTVKCFGQDVYVSLKDQQISGNSPTAKYLVNELAEYARLSVLNYLVNAKDIPLGGELIKPADVPGGRFFTHGTHVLPFEQINHRFDSNSQELLNKALQLGATQLDYGDMAVQLLPFTRIPIVIIVWAGDHEFPTKSSVLFDKNISKHLATDIIWSTAMMTVKMLLPSD